MNSSSGRKLRAWWSSVRTGKESSSECSWARSARPLPPTHTAPSPSSTALPDTDINALAGPVVVGVDGSAHAEPAVSMAFEEAALRHTELVAVHAWSDVNIPFAFEDGDPVWMQIVKDETAQLSEYLVGHAEKYPDVKVRTVVVMDQPAHGLREEAENAQLLVVGSRGRGGFASMLLGSTTRTLMNSVNRPLLIVR